MKELVEYLAKALVEKPEHVELSSNTSETGQTFELRVAPEDIGKIIGRDGRTVNAMRSLLAAVAQRNGQRVRLEVIDVRKTSPSVASNGSTSEV